MEQNLHYAADTTFEIPILIYFFINIITPMPPNRLQPMQDKGWLLIGSTQPYSYDNKEVVSITIRPLTRYATEHMLLHNKWEV